MNYWLLTTEYPPFHGGGISTYYFFTARMMKEAGHNVTVFIADEGVADHEIIPGTDAQGITLVRFSSNRDRLHDCLGYTARLSYAFAGMIRKRIEEAGRPDMIPDIIEVQDYLGIAYYLTQFKHAGYSFLQGIPIVLTLHSPAFIYLEYNRAPVDRFPDFWTGEMEKQAIRGADLLISPTRFLVGEIGRYMDFGPHVPAVLPNPYIAPEKAAPYTSFIRHRIVYYGKLSPQKGSFEMLAYFRDLWDEGFSHALHMIGGTDIVFHPEGLTMGQIVQKRYKKYVDAGLLILHPKIRPDELALALADAHVVIFPSIVDNLPYVVMETMSLGKVVLASQQGGQREMIEDGVDGFLFDHGEPDSFGKKLRAVLNMPDGDLQRMGALAQASVRKKYDPSVILPAKMAILEKFGAAATRTDEPGRFPFLHQEPGNPIPHPQDPLLSVVIPFYNLGAYIEDCIQSILRSTYPSIEILIIDDGSTDEDSLHVLTRLETQHPSLTILRQKNAGLADSRNNGARAAKGDYLAFLDADDKVGPDYYEKTIKVMQRCSNVYFAGSWVQYFEGSEALWPTFTPQPPYVLVHNSVNSSGLVYKRAAFLAGGLNDKKVDYGLEDYGSLVNMMSHGYNGVMLPEPLFYYRVRKGSMFRHLTKEKLLYAYRTISDKNKAYYTKFAVQIINLLNANGPGFQFDNPTLETNVVTLIGREGPWIRRLKSILKKNERLKKLAINIKKKLKP